MSIVYPKDLRIPESKYHDDEDVHVNSLHIFKSKIKSHLSNGVIQIIFMFQVDIKVIYQSKD